MAISKRSHHSSKRTHSSKRHVSRVAPASSALPSATASFPTVRARKLRLYIVHTPTFVERKPNMLALVDRLGRHPLLATESVMVTTPNPENVDRETIQKRVKLERLEDAKWDPHVRNMHVAQVSNALKHFKCLELIAASTEPDALHLVVEDDVCYGDRIGDDLVEVHDLLAARQDWDAVFLGMPSRRVERSGRQFPTIQEGTFAPMLPSCESYVVTPAAARRLVEQYLPVRFMTNKHLSYVFDKDPAGYGVRYSEPNLFSDGSKTGRFVSTLDPSNVLLYNQEWVNAYNVVVKAQTAPDERAVADGIAKLDASPVKDQPDLLNMKAMLRVLQKDYRGAHALFAQAYAGYLQNHAIVNNESTCLRNYIANFKHVQTLPAAM